MLSQTTNLTHTEAPSYSVSEEARQTIVHTLKEIIGIAVMFGVTATFIVLHTLYMTGNL